MKGSRSLFLHAVIYTASAVLLFAPVLKKYFVSDDFLVLNRVCLERVILIKGFFRPLSDISIYLNYLIAGFNPVMFNLTNIVLHGLNSFLLYLVCLNWKWAENKRTQYIYALTTGFFFLTYPFHNESVVWLLGRGSLLASTFGILAMLTLVSSLNERKKIIIVSLCYFIGLTAYESIIALPLIVLVFLINVETALRKVFFSWMLTLLGTLSLHLLVRIYISGSVFGSYGQELIKNNWINNASNIFKVAGRLFLPPLQNSLTWSVLFGVFAFVLILILASTFKNCMLTYQKKYLLSVLGMLMAALIIPILFSVSTKTSESDRFNYFPSVFFCSIIAFAIIKLLKSEQKRLIAILLICIYNCIFLQWNNLHWLKAADTTKMIMSTIKKDRVGKKIFIANLPNEFDGAYVFRLGFTQALLINQIDTSKVVVLNILSREQDLKLTAVVKPVYVDDHFVIPPFLEVKDNNGEMMLRVKEKIYYSPRRSTSLYYWNKKDMLLFE